MGKFYVKVFLFFRVLWILEEESYNVLFDTLADFITGANCNFLCFMKVYIEVNSISFINITDEKFILFWGANFCLVSKQNTNSNLSFNGSRDFYWDEWMLEWIKYLGSYC